MIEKKEPTNNLKYGYLVGLDEAGEFVFEILGKDPGLIEIMGSHSFAKHRINQLRDILQDDGTAFIKKALNAIGKLNEAELKLLTGLYEALGKPLPSKEEKSSKKK